MDLEMTGLDADNDRILEVAVIATDWNFKEIATYDAVVHQPDSVLKNMNEWCKTQHSASGLVEKVKASTKSSKQVEKELLSFIDKHFVADTPVLLAGNSIHMDRRFILKHWPKLDSRLHYRMLDVSAWKVVFEAKFAKRYVKPDKHRALEDIRGSIDELRYYLRKVKV